MKKNAGLFLAGGVLLALAVAFLPGRVTSADPSPTREKAAGPQRQADEAAIRKASAQFSRALEKGDAKAVAALWTEEGEYIAGDGTTIRGRPAIEAAYAKFFAGHPKFTLETTIDAIRFVSRDSAIEEGHARARHGKSVEPNSSRYSTLYARENGRWLMAVVREWPDDGINLRDLDWLIGSWAARTGDAEVHTTYQWDESKKFIRVRFGIQRQDGSISGSQRIGKDPRTGQLRSWLFESDGGFGEALWSWDGKRWLQQATGVQADGSEMSATNILTPLDRDSFTWQSIDRTLDGEELPDTPPVKVRRVK